MNQNGKKEPLLGHQRGGSDEAVLGTPVRESSSSNRNMIWEGTTWQACPPCLMLCAPLTCSVWHWKISNSRIDLIHGCCSSDEETIDLRRVVDLHFHRNFLQLLLGRETITIHSASDEFPELRLTTFGTKEIFQELREAWSRAKIGTAVGYDDQHHPGGHM